MGDPAGIGPEIVSKALTDPRVARACTPILLADPVALRLHHRRLPDVQTRTLSGLSPRLPLGRPSPAAGRSAIAALRQAVALLRTRQAEALVTAPVSKESFHAANFGFPGHTEWLAKEGAPEASVHKKPVAAMLMVAGALRALLMTRHLPLAHVSRALQRADIVLSAILADRFVRRHLRIRKPRLVLCGLNPHAGDGGLLGQEEAAVMAPALRWLKKKGIFVSGPVPADSVFRDMAKGQYDLALAAYHDQGMIPLKLFAPERLVNVTLGLPFIRTSPGHGTAYDIAGKNRADPRPMVEAIVLAATYCR